MVKSKKIIGLTSDGSTEFSLGDFIYTTAFLNTKGYTVPVRGEVVYLDHMTATLDLGELGKKDLYLGDGESFMQSYGSFAKAKANLVDWYAELVDNCQSNHDKIKKDLAHCKKDIEKKKSILKSVKNLKEAK